MEISISNFENVKSKYKTNLFRVFLKTLRNGGKPLNGKTRAALKKKFEQNVAAIAAAKTDQQLQAIKP